jgi:hypothetical protein
VSPTEVAERLERLRGRIRQAGGEKVEVLAVTKGFDRSAVEAALAAGLTDMGENYAQELLEKASVSSPSGIEPVWHFVGRLQRNKVRKLASIVRLWQSVDRLAVGREISQRAPGASVLVQVNASGEPQKGGCAPEAAGELVEELASLGLEVRGLMAVGPTGPPELAREPFRRLVSLADDLHLPVRSIGMTDDLEVAIEEGSTMVRIGRALFGPRPGTGPSS